MIRWFANNGIAANLLMIGILLAGVYSATERVPLEVVPELSAWDIVYMEMPYRGGTPKDIEENVLIPVERALEGVSGIRELNSDGMPGRAKFYFRAKPGVDLDKLLDEIKGRVDTISTFPSETERPKIIIPDSSGREPVLSVAVTGDLDEDALLEAAKQVQRELLEIPGISRADIQGKREREISIEADMAKLRAYQLGFRELADAIRRSSIDLTAGTIRSASGSLVVRTKGQAYEKEDFEKIPIRAAKGGEVLVGEVATVHDGFDEVRKVVEFNGRRSMFVEVKRARGEDAIEISDKVKAYVAQRSPDGTHLYTWNDSSLSIRGRLGTLFWSLAQGCLLVFLVLGLFLRPQVAFWVVLGIPISFAGGVWMMSMTVPGLAIYPMTANVMSLFGFIIVLGVVVDDAIVTGESVYTRLKTGMDPLEASVLGTQEVTVPVTFGVLTTIAAFVPLSFIPGIWGDFAKQIPPVVAPVLLFSLVESKLILPAHLKHIRPRGDGIGLVGRIQQRFAGGLEWMVEHAYSPTLAFAVRHRWSVAALFVAMALAMAGYCAGGRMGFASFPSVENLRISAELNLPNDVEIEQTHAIIERITAAVDTLEAEYVDPGTGETLIRNIARVTGSYDFGGRPDRSRGRVVLEVVPPSERSEPGPRNSEIAARWKELVGEIDEADSFNIRAELTGKRSDEDEGRDTAEPMGLELRGPNSEEKNLIAEKIKVLLGGYEGVSASWAMINRGQDEIEFTLTPRALELGLTQQLLAQQVRQAFYGEEAQRIIRDSEEVRIMVRLPRADRRSLQTLEKLKVRAPTGAEHLEDHEVADDFSELAAQGDLGWRRDRGPEADVDLREPALGLADLRVRRVGQTRDLRECFGDQHAGHQRVAREVAGQPGLVALDLPLAGRGNAQVQLGQSVDETERWLVRKRGQHRCGVGRPGARGIASGCGIALGGGAALFDKRRQRRDGLERLTPQVLVGDLDLELLLDAGHQHQHIQRVQVQVPTDQRHIVGDRLVWAEVEVPADDRLELVEGLGIGRRRQGHGAGFPSGKGRPRTGGQHDRHATPNSVPLVRKTLILAAGFHPSAQTRHGTTQHFPNQ